MAGWRATVQREGRSPRPEGARRSSWDGTAPAKRWSSKGPTRIILPDSSQPNFLGCPSPSVPERLSRSIQNAWPSTTCKIDVSPTHQPVIERHVGSLVATDQREGLVQQPHPALARAWAPESDLKRPRDPTSV